MLVSYLHLILKFRCVCRAWWFVRYWAVFSDTSGLTGSASLGRLVKEVKSCGNLRDVNDWSQIDRLYLACIACSCALRLNRFDHSMS